MKDDLVPSRYGGYVPIRIAMMEDHDLEYGGSSYSANYYPSTNSVSNKKAQREKEIKANIPKRTLMLEKVSNDISTLPHLPSVLWKEIAEYEGGVESSLLGNNTESSIGYWCSIL